MSVDKRLSQVPGSWPRHYRDMHVSVMPLPVQALTCTCAWCLRFFFFIIVIIIVLKYYLHEGSVTSLTLTSHGKTNSCDVWFTEQIPFRFSNSG